MVASLYRIPFLTSEIIHRWIDTTPQNALQIISAVQNSFPAQSLLSNTFYHQASRRERHSYKSAYVISAASSQMQKVFFEGNALLYKNNYKTAVERSRHTQVKQIIQAVLLRFPASLISKTSRYEVKPSNRYIFHIKGTPEPALSIWTPDHFSNTDLMRLSQIIDRSGMMTIFQTQKTTVAPSAMIAPVEIRFMKDTGEGGCLLHPQANLASMKNLLVSLGFTILSAKLYHT